MYAFFSEKKNSQSNTPASTSTSAIIPVNECLCLMLADEIKKYNTAELINFLHKDLGLDKETWKLFAVKRLADFAKECKEKKKCSFSTYRSLKEVLAKYGIKSSSITSIPQFEPGK